MRPPASLDQLFLAVETTSRPSPPTSPHSSFRNRAHIGCSPCRRPAVPPLCASSERHLLLRDPRLVFVVGANDALHQMMAHHIDFVEVHEGDPSTGLSMSMASISPLRRAFGKSICVMSPVITAFELKPSRVTNIFICSEVVFWASSRITNESFSVRPRMKAMGAISMMFFSRYRSTFSGIEHVVKRVIQRAQIGIDFFLQSAGQEPKAFSGFDRGARQDDAVHALGEQGRRWPSPRQDRSCPCPPDQRRTPCHVFRWLPGSGAGWSFWAERCDGRTSAACQLRQVRASVTLGSATTTRNMLFRSPLLKVNPERCR